MRDKKFQEVVAVEEWVSLELGERVIGEYPGGEAESEPVGQAKAIGKLTRERGVSI
ncbi:hypothetical protein L211DRAFT_838521 [Terfezia boudieri ATCC MYA-4762]|uniref:Uncharacterized protein n=1 Tax=Terfezia boudieri ATCC MYA-4762 TaxID=1051890 RepID=A0A3N4LLJ5_9PEZI|nr:hypothetical protein L211DRAFT_838521 [Terfezia boudieri ATCC MYA-4762]